MPIQQEKKQEVAKGQIGGIELRLGVVIPDKNLLINYINRSDLLSNLFGTYRRANIKVQVDGGTWTNYEQVPIADWSYNGDTGTFFSKKPADGTHCIVAFTDKSHTASNCVILGFFNPSSNTGTDKSGLALATNFIKSLTTRFI